MQKAGRIAKGTGRSYLGQSQHILALSYISRKGWGGWRGTHKQDPQSTGKSTEQRQSLFCNYQGLCISFLRVAPKVLLSTNSWPSFQSWQVAVPMAVCPPKLVLEACVWDPPGSEMAWGFGGCRRRGKPLNVEFPCHPK